MILVIDDDKHYADDMAELITSQGYSVHPVHSASAALALLKRPREEPECIILDIMMPHGKEYSAAATEHGRYTGMQLLASIRGVLPYVPVFITTVLRDEHVLSWLREQKNCQLFQKPFRCEMLLNELDKVLGRLGTRLTDRLRRCQRGRKHFREYEGVCVDVLHFLFVPPVPGVISQARTADGHEIRDAILLNAGTSGFWADMRAEFDGKNIPCEFKNYREPIGASEVQQIRLRLDKPSLGRFGLLFSRVRPSDSAYLEQRHAYAGTPRKLILLLDDALVVEMIRVKDSGRPPDSVLQRLKTQFEISY
jgi:CheY-like chemotaxis protein